MSQAKRNTTMRLITHNMLKSNVKGVVSGFPLKIEADKVDVRESEFNAGRWHRAVDLRREGHDAVPVV